MPQVSLMRRSLEHVVAAVTLALPLNAAITYTVASISTSPLTIMLTTSLLATLISWARTYLVLYQQDQRECRITAAK